jgi:hypothetical protein
VRARLIDAAFAFVASVLAPLAACTPASATRTSATSIAAPSASASAPPLTSMGARVTLRDAGTEPRRALRFTFDEAEPRAVLLSIEQRGQVEGGALVVQPRIDLRLALEIEKRSVEGDVIARYRVVKAEASAPPSRELEQTRAALASIERASVPVIFTARGEVAVTGLLRGDDGTESAAGMLVFDVLRDLDAPLPVERVGIGARWDVVPEHGDEASFRLESLDDTSAVVRVERRAIARAIEDPSAARGARAVKEATLTLRFQKLDRDARLVVRTTATVGAPNMPPRAGHVERVATITLAR